MQLKTVLPAVVPPAGSIKPAFAAALAASAGVATVVSPLSVAPLPSAGARPAHHARVAALPAVPATSHFGAAVAPPATDARRGVSTAFQPTPRSPALPIAEALPQPTTPPTDVAALPVEQLASATSGFPPPLPASGASMGGAELRAMLVEADAGAGAVGRVASTAQESTEPVSEGLALADGESAQTAQAVDFNVATRVNGRAGRRVALRITDGENITVRLKDLLAAVQPTMDAETFQALSTSSAAGEYVTFNTLRASGIPIRFDAHDRLIIGRG